MSKEKNILPRIFDIKPVKKDVSLNPQNFKKKQKTNVFINKKLNEKIITGNNFSKNASRLRLTDVVKPPNSSATKNIKKYYHQNQFQPQAEKLTSFFEASTEKQNLKIKNSEYLFSPIKTLEKPEEKKKLKTITEKIRVTIAKIFPKNSNRLPLTSKLNYACSFVSVLILFSLTIPTLSYVQKAFDIKTSLVIAADAAINQFTEAKEDLSSGQFDQAAVNFSESYQILSDANRNIEKLGGNFSEILRFIPGISKLSSANYILSAGKHFSLAGKSLAESAKTVNSMGNPLDTANQSSQPSLTDIFLNLQNGVQKSSIELSQAEDDLNKVNIEDLPIEARNQFAEIKKSLPLINVSLKNFLDYSQIFLDILGYNGPRKYLFLFQNNQEMRATGGFIGSYGILDISNGRVKKLFVDDIYNPDGQLKARVIPPAPIQKMSAVWTMHDANWFPDFPTSAEKVSWFYEKTGGPTVDGVIAITPELLRSLLEITGPIEMPEYNTTIEADNFIEKTQYEVEVNYNKEENQPKKIIADLTPKIFDEVFAKKGIMSLLKILKAFDKALSEKHLLLYSRNYNIQKLISAEKWSGEILNTEKDYLSVINTNINGYKTDGVIDEIIEHRSEIQNDGSIIDTVTVTRKHNGGNEKYDWWNKVNGDWMRIYVPRGARLLEVSGQTREIVPPALDYQSLGFKTDPQVQANDDSAHVDEESGTKIYEENNKTVFANWVYVSPGEQVTITYRYVLPFKLSFDDLHHPADSFSVLYQKQSGSIGSKLISEVKLPDNFHPIWYWPDGAKENEKSFKIETILNTDRFVGIAIEDKK